MYFKGMGGHQSASSKKDEWLTPPWILKKFNKFDLDPCSPLNRPWDTAKKHFTIEDDGLNQEWEGKIWLNPPYGDKAEAWLRRLAKHGDGIALIFARTETKWFVNEVWAKADSLLFLHGRLTFHHADGTVANHNSGAPSVLVSYGEENSLILKKLKVQATYINNWHNKA
jgi:hypothetical protein